MTISEIKKLVSEISQAKHILALEMQEMNRKRRKIYNQHKNKIRSLKSRIEAAEEKLFNIPKEKQIMIEMVLSGKKGWIVFNLDSF